MRNDRRRILISATVIALVAILTERVGSSYFRHDRHVRTLERVEIKGERDSISIADSVYTYIFDLRLDHPDVVMAQCIEESGNFTSPLFKKGHNCTGMKVPSRRPTLARGVLNGHARFDSWKACIDDYAIWQSIYARDLDRKAYLAYLDRVYAEKKGYSERLERIIREREL